MRRLNEVSGTLSDLFNTKAELLHNAEFHLQMEEDEFDRLLGEKKPQNLFLMPAERNGLHLFFRELATRRMALLHHASRENIDFDQLLRDVIRSPYAIPIADYIDWLNQLTDIQRGEPGEFHLLAEKLKKDLTEGSYHVDRRTGDIEFKPYQKKRDGQATQRLGLHMTSSAVKSLFGLWFYLENQAKKGDILMIDEPELNLHPENQRTIARLLANLVNVGINVVISTHSDYIVRELNTLIMLSGDDGSLRGKHKYRKEEILNPDKVAAWLFDEQKIKRFDIFPDDGISASTFDKVIKKLNATNDDIYYSLQEKRHDKISD